MKTLVEYMAQGLIGEDRPLEVTETEDDQSVVLAIRVSKEDLGKIIGKQGRTIRALRLILGAAATKAKKRYSLAIRE